MYANGPKIVTDGLVLCLDAANRKSYPGTGTVWNDLSGNGNNGTFGPSTAAPTFSGDNGGSLVFDGSNDYINVGSGSSLTSGYINITVSTWFYPLLNTTRSDIVTKYLYPQGWLIYFSSNRFAVDGRENSATYIQNQSSDTYSVNNWYNIVFTKNSTNWKVYVNSTIQADNTWGNGTTPFSNSVPFAVGRIGSSPSYAKGQISNVQAYNRALSADEIRQNYNALKGRYGLT